MSPPSAVKKLPAPPIAFPASWSWFVDEWVPAFVKQRYSPKESWRDKPFAREDVRFFSKGVRDLSELFTEERPERMPSYFQHPKFRSAYLLYFLPLQMAKFVTLFARHSRAIDAALEHGRSTGVLRVADLGAGPGTASLALLLCLLESRSELPPIELLWLDTERSILEDGKALVEAVSDQFPKLRGKVSVSSFVEPWWEAPSRLSKLAGPNARPNPKCSLILLGHVLNEARNLPSRTNPESVWASLLERADGGGALIVEPATHSTAQHLSQLRDALLEEDVPLWGPCLHAGRCPLSFGKDWCHFSVPVKMPGKWFAELSKELGSERQWVKFSYLWLAPPRPSSPKSRPPQPNPNHRLVISDPLSKSGEVLLCEPERPGRVPTAPLRSVWRGDVLEIKKHSARP